MTESQDQEWPRDHSKWREVRRRFSPLRCNYVTRVLTTNELEVISDLADALIIARIKRMGIQRLEKFDDLVPDGPKQHQHYRSLQLRWLQDEQYLLGTRLGRSPTERELFIDFMNHCNGLRFRAYFAMKYPSKMRHKDQLAAC